MRLGSSMRPLHRWRDLRYRVELVGVIVELPLVTIAEIAAGYRPGGGVTAKAVLRRLREREFVSEGVTEHPRGVDGRVAGAWHVYSALNLDAARAARRHDEAGAKAIAQAASRIERRTATVGFVGRLAQLGGTVSLRRRSTGPPRLMTILPGRCARLSTRRPPRVIVW